MNGAYLLLIHLAKDTTITVGKQGSMSFQHGYYAYVGSALNGLEQRIQRHLRKQKKIHWHIDYLLNHATIVAILYKQHHRREECSIAHTLEKHLSGTPRFGCSDCSCRSHLFHGSLKEITTAALAFHMKPYQVDTNP